MKKSHLLFVLSALLLLSAPAYAESDYHPFKTLGRGLSNILTSPFEIPKQTMTSVNEAKTEGQPSAVWAFSGFFKGMVNMIGRIGSGLADIGRSSFDKSPEPLMDPPCVFSDWPSCGKDGAMCPVKETKEKAASEAPVKKGKWSDDI